MGNIANPLFGTKVDGSTFAAAECNPMGTSLTRCLVNDGQSDLLANASISGGTNKSFAFAGLTTFGLACSGARTESCGSYALTCSGAATFTAASFALTTTGLVSVAAGGALSIAAGGPNNLAISSPLNLGLDAGNDVNLAAGNNINLSPLVSVVVEASRLSMTGAGWPQIGSRAFSSYVPQSAPLVVSGFAYAASEPGLLRQSASAGVVEFFLHVPPGAIVSGASFRVAPATFPVTLPSAKPEITLYAVDALSGAVSTLGTAVDPSSTGAAYSAAHAVSVAVTPFVVSASQRLFVRLKGATDADANKWLLVPVAPTLSVTFTQIRLA